MISSVEAALSKSDMLDSLMKRLLRRKINRRATGAINCHMSVRRVPQDRRRAMYANMRSTTILITFQIRRLEYWKPR
jgi:hypothetical protein